MLLFLFFIIFFNINILGAELSLPDITSTVNLHTKNLTGNQLDFFSQLELLTENNDSQAILQAALIETKEANNNTLEKKTTPLNPVIHQRIIEKRRFFFNGNLEDEQKIHEKRTKQHKINCWIPLAGESKRKIYFGGQCPQCFEKFWLKDNQLPEKKVRKNLIAILANHKHKYCPKNPNASRVEKL